jgi:hypothetical protein
MTSAVIGAIRTRLEMERRKKGSSTTAERILAFSKRFSQGLPPGLSSADHADLLYDESGLPK